MLVVTRRDGESLIISLGKDRVEVKLIESHRGRVRLGVDAPKHVAVNRDELQREIDAA